MTVVARGLGIGGNTVQTCGGLAKRVSYIISPGGRSGGAGPGEPRRWPVSALAPRDERDLLDLMPAIIGVLNANRRH